MPRGDGTGPRGQGVRTGRGMGGCGTGTGRGMGSGSGRMNKADGIQSGSASGGQQRPSTGQSYSIDWRSFLSDILSRL